MGTPCNAAVFFDWQKAVYSLCRTDVKENLYPDRSAEKLKWIIDTRITVETILVKMGEGATAEDLLQSYPHTSKEYLISANQER